MLGPSLDHKGGMAAVERHILRLNLHEFNSKISHISTYEEVSAIRRLKIFFVALLHFSIGLVLNRFEVIHLHVSERGSVFRLSLMAVLGILFNKPVLIHMHGCEFDSFYDNLPTYMQQIISSIFRRCYVIALSQSWKDYYICSCGLDAEKIITLYNPVDLHDQIPDRRHVSKTRFIFMGKIGERKGAFDLIQAVANLPEIDRDKLEVVIAGNGDICEAQEKINRLELQDCISVVGWLTRSECDQQLKNSHVFVLPSYNEGLPMAMLEAMGWGLAVISTEIGGIPEIVEHGRQGLLITPGNLTQLSDSIKYFIDHPSARLRMSKRSRHRVSLLNTEDYHDSLNSLYKNVLSGKAIIQKEMLTVGTLESL